MTLPKQHSKNTAKTKLYSLHKVPKINWDAIPTLTDSDGQNAHEHAKPYRRPAYMKYIDFE